MFLGSEQWGNSEEVVVNLEDMARGTLTLKVSTLGLEGRFMFLGSEQWGNSEEVVVNLEDMARGALTLQVSTPRSGGALHVPGVRAVG